MKRRRQIKLKMNIRYKFTLIIFFVTLVLICAGVSAGYFLGYNLVRKTVGEEHRKMAQILAQSVADMISKKTHEIKTFSNSPMWKNAIMESNLKYEAMEAEAIYRYLINMDKKWIDASDDDPLVKEYLERPVSVRLEKLVEDEITISEMFLTNRFGALVALSGKTTDFYQADEKWWQGAFDNEKGRVFIGDIGFDRSANVLSLPFSVPIRDNANEVIGICKAVIDIKTLFEPLDNFRIGKSGHAVLVDEKGYILFHHGVEPLSVRFCSEEDLQKVLKSERKWQVLYSPHIHKKETFMAWAKIKQPILLERGIVWRVLIDQETEEVFAPLKTLLLHLVIIIGSLLIILLPLGFIFGGMFVKPIETLHEATKYIAKGDLNYRIEVKTGDEIEELADSFKAMVSNIKDKQREILREKVYAESIISSMIDTLIVINPDGTIKGANKATLDLLGYKEEELIGKHVNLIFTEEEEEEESLFRGTRFKKLIKEGSVRDFEMTYKTKDGEKIPVSFSGSVMYKRRVETDSNIGQGAEIVGIVGVARDMRQIEALITDLEKSKAELEKWSETLERKVEERTKELAQSQETTLKIMEELQEAHAELEETQAHLIQAEKMEAVGRMASGVAHEVENPLGIIIQGVNYLEGELPKAKKDVLGALQMIKDNIKRADNIIRALVDFSRATELKIKPEDTNSILENSLTLVQYEFKARDITVVKELRDKLPKILADKGKMEQVFVNIFLNAIYAMSQGGELFIRTYQLQMDRIRFRVGRRKSDGDYFELGETAVVVEIEDTGSGIPNDKLQKVFDPFFTTKEVGKGVGLGLAVTRNIIDLHKGVINIESEKGKGTKVVLTLKVSKGG